MKSTVFLFFVLVFVFFFSCSKKEVLLQDDADAPNNPASFNVNKDAILDAVNKVRASGCTCGSTVMPPVPPVTWNDQLARAAYDHSIDMDKNNYFNHNSLDGRDPGERITAAGYIWQSYGENIAKGYTSEKAVMEGWLASEGHCKNIMRVGFKEVGVGRQGSYWTQDFGSR